MPTLDRITIYPYADLPPLEPREFAIGEVRLRADVDASRWGDLYRLGVNTAIVQARTGPMRLEAGLPVSAA